MELLQMALGVRDALSHAPTDAEWNRAFRFAREHAVVGVMFSGVGKLAKEQAPPKSLLMSWLLGTEQIKKQKSQFDDVMADFAKLLSGWNIHYVVFKGLAVASKYPDPSLRTMGDIDFYVPPNDFDRCLRLIECKLGLAVNTDDIDKHYSFYWKGICFEMHYQMETFGCKSHQMCFGSLVDDGISAGVSHFYANETAVAMLNPALDLILVFKHWMTHYIGEGIGMRQTVDLAVLIASYKDEINVATIKGHLRDIGYLMAFDAVVAMVEKFFKIHWSDYWMDYNDGFHKKNAAMRHAGRMMKEVLRNGNFGRSDYKYKFGRMKRFETMLRFLRHSFWMLPLAPKEIACMLPRRMAISMKAHKNTI